MTPRVCLVPDRHDSTYPPFTRKIRPLTSNNPPLCRILGPMAFDNQPRHSTGRPTGSGARPRRAYQPGDEPPIMSGYTYHPTITEDPTQPQQPPEPDNQSGSSWGSRQRTPRASGYSQAHPSIPQRAYEPLSPGWSTPNSIDNYKPKSHIGLYIGIVVLIVVAVIGAFLLNSLPGPEEKPTNTTAPWPTPTDTRTGGIAFDNGSVKGYWLITKTAWSSHSVTITVEIQVDSGTLYYDFYAYGLDDRSQNTPTYEGPQALEPGFAGPDQVVRGTITFEVPRQDLTLVLAGSFGTQLSALTVSG